MTELTNLIVNIRTESTSDRVLKIAAAIQKKYPSAKIHAENKYVTVRLRL